MFSKLFLAATLAFSLVHGRPTHSHHHKGSKVHPIKPGDITSQNIFITSDNTLNGTAEHRPGDVTAGPNAALPINLVNNFASDVNVYVTGRDDNGAPFFVKSDGSLYYPTNPPAGAEPVPVDHATIAIPVAVAQTYTLNMGSYTQGGRIWYAAGELAFFVVNGQNGANIVEPSAVNLADPSAGKNWGFVELTWNANQFYANISYVDFVGLVAAISLDGSGGTVTAKGLPVDSVGNICNQLNAQSGADGLPWNQLCVLGTDGAPLRVLAPGNLPGGTSPFDAYFGDYVNRVYSNFGGADLTVNTPYGDVVGRSNGDNLVFNGDPFPKPNAQDILGCNSGPFANTGDDTHKAIVARLCAAFHRTTLLIGGGNDQPNGVRDSASYYTADPTNHYARIVHTTELDGKGYAFAYDDVAPNGGPDQSGATFDPSPTKFTVNIGGL